MVCSSYQSMDWDYGSLGVSEHTDSTISENYCMIEGIR